MDNQKKDQSNFESNNENHYNSTIFSQSSYEHVNNQNENNQLQQNHTDSSYNEHIEEIRSEQNFQSQINESNPYYSAHFQENPNNNLLPNQNDSRHTNERKSGWIKKLIAYLSVGVISSAVTIGALIYFDFPIGNSNGESGYNVEIQKQSNDVEYTPTFASADQASIADVVEELSPTIVGVINLQQMNNHFNFQSQNVQAGTGSGVIFHKDDKYGYIITNNHVIEGASEVEVSLYDGETVKAEIVGSDALTDLAVLKIDGSYVKKIATFGDSNKIRPGDEVIAIGNPLGLEFSRTVTQGIISAIDRTVAVTTSAGEWELDVIQTDAAINPGNSGGALINANGEVIGINSLKIADERVEGLGFAIPTNDVLPIAEQLIQNGVVKRPFIGIEMYDIADIVPFYRQSMFGNIENGIVVAGIREQSPAAKAGLQVNDVIVGIDGNEVKDSKELRKYLYSEVKPGDTIKIEFYRDGKRQSVNVETIEN